MPDNRDPDETLQHLARQVDQALADLVARCAAFAAHRAAESPSLPSNHALGQALIASFERIAESLQMRAELDDHWTLNPWPHPAGLDSVEAAIAWTAQRRAENRALWALTQVCADAGFPAGPLAAHPAVE